VGAKGNRIKEQYQIFFIIINNEYASCGQTSIIPSKFKIEPKLFVFLCLLPMSFKPKYLTNMVVNSIYSWNQDHSICKHC